LGASLIEKMREQAKKFGAKIVDKNIVKVNFSKRPFEIYLPDSATQFLSHESLTKDNTVLGPLESEKIAFASSIIIATGAKALWLNVPGEQELRGKGVSACATCDGFFFREKTVAVVGGGDTALEEALTLTKFAKKVYIIHRRDSFRASKIMQERVFSNKKIEVIWNAQVVEVMGKNHLEGIKIKSTRGENLPQFKILAVDGLFVAIGHKPDTEIFASQVELDEKGYVITTQRLAMELAKLKNKNEKLEKIINKFDFNYQMITSVPGVFAAGDCVDIYYRQAATASGMGVAAALEVEKWLEENK